MTVLFSHPFTLSMTVSSSHKATFFTYGCQAPRALVHRSTNNNNKEDLCITAACPRERRRRQPVTPSSRLQVRHWPSATNLRLNGTRRLCLSLVKNCSSNKQRKVNIGEFRNLWIVVVAEPRITPTNRNWFFCCAPCHF